MTNFNSTNKERLMKLETEVTYIKEIVNDVKNLQVDFIKAADKKYATKEEVAAIRGDVLNNTDDIKTFWKKYGNAGGITILLILQVLNMLGIIG